MKTTLPPIVEDDLAVAWARAFVAGLEDTVAPLMVSVTGFMDGKPTEDPAIRRLLQQALEREKSIEEVASTIFPQCLWNPADSADAVFGRFKAIWPMVKSCNGNHRGHYFQRLTAFDNPGGEPVNQLKHIISTWRDFNNHRKSALQASVFDPRTDHTNSNRGHGFPCLHQVGFVPLGPNGQEGLAVTGFYPHQHLFRKAYGNYLGLARLGRFMAHYMGLRLRQVTCVVGVAEVESTKSFNRAAQRALATSLAAHIGTLKPGS